ncbi:sugar transferase [Gephyromycinifex aptenodytis]|uniref:sugar transferase n=1 Tax=Gephyromycinifex aptenodytis TaxID=2716227 RepID=UPI0014450A08|nr:sugar transferase [Gephyromycinifex aptenodytis]
MSADEKVELRSRRHERPRATERVKVASSDIPFAPSLGGAQAVARRSRSEDWAQAYLARVLGWDVFVGVLGAVLASVLRFGDGLTPGYVLLSAAIPVTWVLALAMSNAYERRYLGVSVEEYRAVGRAVVGVLAALAIAAFVANVLLARTYVGILLPLLLLGGLLVRRFMRRWLMARRSQGLLMQRTIVVGRADAAAALIRSISAEPLQGLQPVAVCASGLDGDWEATGSIEGVPVMGRPRDAVAAADLYDAECVAVASHPDLAGKALRRLAWALEERGMDLIVSPGLLDVAGPRLSIRPSSNLSLLHIERPAAARRAVFLKQAMDRSLAFVLLLLLSPILIAVAIAIKVTDRGPVFFRQQRVGVGGELFSIFKFRTMVVDAEERLAALARKNEGNGVLFKLQDDPRVTRVGKILRRYSIDELPQLLNVLIGDMSLVGPRPPLAREVEQYEPDALRRLHVRPGMTGLWQVSGRSDLSWEESLRLDLRYVDNWSPIGDLHILFRTFRAVTGGSGAY